MFKSAKKLSLSIARKEINCLNFFNFKLSINSILFSHFSKGEIKVPRSEIKKMLDNNDNILKKQISQ